MATENERLARLDRALKAAGHVVDGLTPLPGGLVKVWPESMQAVCQPIIDSFDPDDPVYIRAERDAAFDAMTGVRALALATYELKDNPSWTQGQFLARIRTIYRSL